MDKPPLKDDFENLKKVLDRKTKEFEIIKQISSQINKTLDVNLIASAMLNAMEINGIDPETVANRPEFSVLIHFLKSIIDGELNIPNDLTDTIRNKSEEFC